jgi:hypothetical protein
MGLAVARFCCHLPLGLGGVGRLVGKGKGIPGSRIEIEIEIEIRGLGQLLCEEV